jgi:imidazolonepropionase-like amidohydrolase
LVPYPFPESTMLRALVRSAVLALTLAPALVAGAQEKGAPAPRKLAVKAARLIDGTGAAPITNAVVLIEGDRITAVGSGLAIPRGTEVIDLGGATLMPGLIDMHTHVTSQPGDFYEDIFRKSPVDNAVTAHLYARRTLDAGFTTIRNAGAPEYVDIALRNAITRGEVAGPRIVAATSAIGATGGHGDLNGMSPYLRIEGVSGIADGVDAIRKLVRTQVKYGADVIKMIATAGVLSEEESVGAPQYSAEEMTAMVEEAAMWGRRVMAHAHGAEGIKRAIRAGVASVEHASFIDDEGIALAKQKGTFLVMDVYNDDYILAEYAKLGYPEKIIAKERLVGRTQRENFRKALQAGAKMAFGTDAGVYPHGWNAKQFGTMVEWGMTPMQAIVSATSSAAELLGQKDKVGTIAAGRWADLVATAGNPLDNVRELEKVQFVLKGGVVFKQGGTSLPFAPK